MVDVVVIPIGFSTSHRAEAIVALYTVRIALEIGYHKLWLEGDSLNIINMLNNRNMVMWNIEGSILEIKNLLNKFYNVIISHNYQEGNKVADWIANKAANVNSKMTWANNLSKEGDLKVIINYDMTNAIEGKIT